MRVLLMTETSSTNLDRFLPAGDFREFHQISVPATAGHVFRAIKEVTIGELPLMTTLMVIRSLPAIVSGRRRLSAPGQKMVLNQFLEGGFRLLAEDVDSELVFGVIGKFWKPMGAEFVRFSDTDGFVNFARPGFARAAVNCLIREQGDGSVVLSTETRIAAIDEDEQKKFRAYWTLIRVGSGLIRREWLQAISVARRSCAYCRVGFCGHHKLICSLTALSATRLSFSVPLPLDPGEVG